MFTQISRSQTAQRTTAARAGSPIRASARTDSRAVAPVVSTSSTSTTSAFVGIGGTASRPGIVVIRPRRLCTRSRGVKPTESCTPHHTRSRDTIWLSGSQLVATNAVRCTGSPPRRRAAARRLGAGTSTSGRSRVRSRASPPASASPSGSARSRRPRSLAASTARRAGPAYGPSVQHGTPGSVLGHTRVGGAASTAAHSSHHPTPAVRQPAHEAGKMRSSRVRIARVCAHPPTSDRALLRCHRAFYERAISRAAPGRRSRRGPAPRASTARHRPGCWSARAPRGNRPRTDAQAWR